MQPCRNCPFKKHVDEECNQTGYHQKDIIDLEANIYGYGNYPHCHIQEGYHEIKPINIIKVQIPFRPINHETCTGFIFTIIREHKKIGLPLPKDIQQYIIDHDLSVEEILKDDSICDNLKEAARF